MDLNIVVIATNNVFLKKRNGVLIPESWHVYFTRNCSTSLIRELAMEFCKLFYCRYLINRVGNVYRTRGTN